MPKFSDMPYRVLGRTGAHVSAIGLGGWHIGLKTISEALSLRIIRSAIDRGINLTVQDVVNLRLDDISS